MKWTRELLARCIGNECTTARTLSSALLLFILKPAELDAAIRFNPEIPHELALVWSKAKAGQNTQNAAQALEVLVANQSCIRFASGLHQVSKKYLCKSTTCKCRIDRR